MRWCGGSRTMRVSSAARCRATAHRQAMAHRQATAHRQAIASSGDGASLGDAGAWLDPAPRPGAHLIAFDALYRAARRSDLDGWRAGLVRFSASWAKPLLDALDRGAVARVSIRDERGHRFTATRWGRFRWRRRGGLAATIAAAARHVR